MRILHQVRKLNAWSRALLVAFVFAFGLNSVAHAAHQHEPASATTSLHSTACGYCVSLDHLAHFPTPAAFDAFVAADPIDVARGVADTPLARPRATAQPRAPPILI